MARQQEDGSWKASDGSVWSSQGSAANAEKAARSGKEYSDAIGGVRSILRFRYSFV